MDARIIDGVAEARALLETLKGDVRAFTQEAGRAPGLAVILVGADPASEVYVRAKMRKADELGIHSEHVRLPADTTQGALSGVIDALNANPAIDGILLQLPLPGALDHHAAIARIAPEKDVDGLHPVSAGRLAQGWPGFVPCTPEGCLVLLRRVHESLAGMDALVIGRSELVGRPMAALLLIENCTVTVAHSRTRELTSLARRADILVAAVGRPEFITRDWVKPGATVIDVGINRKANGGLVGDVAYDDVRAVAGALTPVPGGVGPMTVACLMRNTLVAAKNRAS